MLDRTNQPQTKVDRGPSSALIATLAIATGALIANLYYAQPLVASIGPEIGISPDLAGSVVSVTQIGYGVGLFLLVSLADVVENRMLVLVTLGFTALGLVGVALSTAAVPFFAASFVIGLCSTGAQVLLPFVAQMVPVAQRGRIVGNVMAGVLTGIMLARPVSLFVSAALGWRAIFWLSALLMIGIGIALARMMPRYKPRTDMTYGQSIASMPRLLRDIPLLRWRSAYQALMFAAFNMFWTAIPLPLKEQFGLGEHAIALFALAGAGGALAAPIAGRMGDRGFGRVMTAIMMVALGLGFFATMPAVTMKGLVLLAVLAIVIDAAVQGNQVVSQRVIFSVAAETRGRVNAIYMTITFAGGAIGSVLGTLTYHWGGWNATAITGGLMGLLALLLLGAQVRFMSAPRRAK